MGNWSELLIEVIGVIVGRLEFLSDIQRSAFVCLSWRSVAMESGHLFHPMLITSYEGDAETCNLYSPLDKKAFKLHLPELHNKWICGTSGAGSWLVTVDDDAMVSVLHPFSRAQVSLPPSPPLSPCSVRCRAELIEGYPGSGRWKCNFVEKLIVSGNPLNPDCRFVRIGGPRGQVWLCRATDDTWTSLEGPRECIDGTFYEGRLYLVSHYWGDIWICDINGSIPEEGGRVIGRPALRTTRPSGDCRRDYLVESSGDLLLVIRDRYLGIDGREYNETSGFEVFKLIHNQDPYNAKESWRRITCLGGQALFLGCNQSFSLPAARYSGYKANHIYFSDDSDLGLSPCDTGEFNLEDGSVTFYHLDLQALHWPPLWFKQH